MERAARLILNLTFACMLRALFLGALLAFWAVTACAQVQVGMEAAGTPGLRYPAEWPSGPPRSSAPDWAKPGHIRFARWDGGPIETAKAFLSGWPNFNPPLPAYVQTMTDWYDPSTIKLLREANINTIWVTFSNGFSIPTERIQREQLRQYIEECHQQGIRVFAYLSLQNMFWEDMFEHVPESRGWVSIGADAKPVPYGAADYGKTGRVTRYMANLASPGWRAYLRRRIDLAIDAGVDGLFYDNNASTDLLPAYQEIYQYGSSRKHDLLVMANFHSADFVYNRNLNCITTEEGREPGIYSAANLAQSYLKNEKESLLPVEGGFLVTGAGLFRLLDALSEGWKPVMVENGARETGVRETTPMSKPRQQLALAESMAFGVSAEVFVEGAVAHRLRAADPEMMDIWRGIGAYNRFFADQEQYYNGTRSTASLAVVLDDRSAAPHDEGPYMPLLYGLAARNVIYDVLYERDLTPAVLGRYSGVALLTAETVREQGLQSLQSWVTNGGRLFTAGTVASRDEHGRQRARPTFFGRKEGKGECIYYDRIPPMDDLARDLKGAARPPIVRIDAPITVLYNVVEQPESAAGRVLVHLLNFAPRPVGKIEVTATGKYRSIRLLTPDVPREPVHVISASGSATQIEVPSLVIYSLLVFEKTGTNQQ